MNIWLVWEFQLDNPDENGKYHEHKLWAQRSTYASAVAAFEYLINRYPEKRGNDIRTRFYISKESG